MQQTGRADTPAGSPTPATPATPATPTAPTAPGTATQGLRYDAEIRFGIVMYGGVSLAIYINGVTNELYEMCCATPRDGFVLEPSSEPSTRDIFRRIAYLCGNPELRQRYAAKLRRNRDQCAPGSTPAEAWDAADEASFAPTRFVVDVVSGTSAGGINGVFLAKALANGEQFGALKDLWVNEGDIGLLLNDRRSYADIGDARRGDKPASLLNSDRMYIKLRQALEAMAPVPLRSAPADGGSPFADELDLFVTTTDIAGSVVPIRLFDKVVHERRHKQSYQFSYPNGITGNDFRADNNAFLAFAARCTSSFPFAFEPMNLHTVTRLAGKVAGVDTARWNGFFPNLPKDEIASNAHVHRAFGDGGYLDNKPFSYVADVLARRVADVPIERKLLYVEPSPQRLDPAAMAPAPADQPDALSNSIAALTSIPMYETIREDLQAVLKRNRRIERVERIVRLGEADIERGLRQAGENERRVLAGRDWASLTLREQLAIHGTAFAPYLRLRVVAVTDILADRLAERWAIDSDSDYHYALRALVRAWRESQFDDAGSEGRATVNAFLVAYDLDYRLRRLGLLLRKTDQLIRIYGKYRARAGMEGGAAAPPPVALSESDQQLLGRLAGCQPRDGMPGLDVVLDVLRALQALRANLADIRAAMTKQRCEQGRARDGETDPLLRAELLLLLGMILGEPVTGEPAVTDIHGQRQRVRLDAVPERVASSSRTLQEAVLTRAKALLDTAGGASPTRIQAALERSITSMRLDAGTPGRPGEAMLSNVAARIWKILGKPAEAAAGAEAGPAAQAAQAAQSAPPVVAPVARDAGEARPLDGELAALNTPAGTALRALLSEYYLRFDSFDQIGFPLYFDTGTGEPATVEVARVSPQDAVNLIDERNDPRQRRKLAGTALANFGAFLDRRWRLNDAMWGRLDGAERLIRVLLPMADADTRLIREELTERAHGLILRQELLPGGQGKLAELFCEAMGRIPAGTPRAEIDALLARLALDSLRGRENLAGCLTAILGEEGLLDYVRKDRDIDRNPDPKTTLASGARAVSVMGKVLEGVAARHGAGTAGPRWLARMGLVLQGTVAVSLPGTLRHRWWTHALKLLYAFEVMLFLLALPFGDGATRTLAISALAVTVLLHLLTLVMGDLLRARRRWQRWLLAAAIAGIVILAVLGLLVLGFHLSGWRLAPPVEIIVAK